MDVKCWGASELKRRNRRAVPGACRAPGARLQYHVTHSAAKIKHVRTLLPLRLEAPILSSLPSSFILFFFFPPTCMPPLKASQKTTPHLLIFIPPQKTGPSFLVCRHQPASGISHGCFFFFFLILIILR